VLSSPCTTGASLWQVVHQKAKNSTNVGRPTAKLTVVGSVASSAVRTGRGVGTVVDKESVVAAGAGVAGAVETSVRGRTADGVGVLGAAPWQPAMISPARATSPMI
jgi:hypothetical protein